MPSEAVTARDSPWLTQFGETPTISQPALLCYAATSVARLSNNLGVWRRPAHSPLWRMPGSRCRYGRPSNLLENSGRTAEILWHCRELFFRRCWRMCFVSIRDSKHCFWNTATSATAGLQSWHSFLPHAWSVPSPPVPSDVIWTHLKLSLCRRHVWDGSWWVTLQTISTTLSMENSMRLPSEAEAIWRESACKVGVRHDGSGVKDVLGLVYGDNSTTMTMTGTNSFLNLQLSKMQNSRFIYMNIHDIYKYHDHLMYTQKHTSLIISSLYIIYKIISINMTLLSPKTIYIYTHSFQRPHALSSVTKDVNAEFKSWKRSFSSLLTLECLGGARQFVIIPKRRDHVWGTSTNTWIHVYIFWIYISYSYIQVYYIYIYMFVFPYTLTRICI